MIKIFQTNHTASNDVFALKVMNRKWLRNKRLTKRIENELRVHRNLSHKNILKMMNYFYDTKHVFIVLEFCSNFSLFQYLRKFQKQNKTLSRDLKEKFIFEIMEGVNYLHDQSVVHRDLKLSNILLTESFEIKIADFGLALELKDRESKRKTFCGTANYMAPEVHLKLPYDGFKADIWSFGCLFYSIIKNGENFKTSSKSSESSQTETHKRLENLKEDSEFSENEVELLKLILNENKPFLRPTCEEIKKHEGFRKMLKHDKTEDKLKQETKSVQDKEVVKEKEKEKEKEKDEERKKVREENDEIEDLNFNLLKGEEFNFKKYKIIFINNKIKLIINHKINIYLTKNYFLIPYQARKEDKRDGGEKIYFVELIQKDMSRREKYLLKIYYFVKNIIKIIKTNKILFIWNLNLNKKHEENKEIGCLMRVKYYLYTSNIEIIISFLSIKIIYNYLEDIGNIYISSSSSSSVHSFSLLSTEDKDDDGKEDGNDGVEDKKRKFNQSISYLISMILDYKSKTFKQLYIKKISLPFNYSQNISSFDKRVIKRLFNYLLFLTNTKTLPTQVHDLLFRKVERVKEKEKEKEKFPVSQVTIAGLGSGRQERDGKLKIVLTDGTSMTLDSTASRVTFDNSLKTYSLFSGAVTSQYPLIQREGNEWNKLKQAREIIRAIPKASQQK